MRDVAVIMCEEPAVREVYKKRRGSSSNSFRLNGAAMVGEEGGIAKADIGVQGD